MIEAALKYLTSLADAARAARTFTSPDKHAQGYYLQTPEGQTNWIPATIPPRAHRAASLTGFADLYKRYGLPAAAPIFFAAGRAVAIIDDAELRASSLTYSVPLSHQFTTVEELTAEEPLRKQREFINLLRIDLANCVDADLIAQLRSLRHNTTAGTTATTQQGKESLGRSVLAALVTEAGDLPEDVTITIPVYEAETASLQAITCALIVNTEDMSFGLIPKAGELTRAKIAADQEIIRVLSAAIGTEVPIIHAQP
jgi:hypothetical protein